MSHLKHYWRLLMKKEERSKYSNPAKLTWANIKAVFQAFFRKRMRNIGGLLLKDHIYEQIIWRRTQVMHKSPQCWRDGKCKVCGCDILGKTMEDRGCERSCYPFMRTEKTWKKYKELLEIKLFD